jgi:hypothetical protein
MGKTTIEITGQIELSYDENSSDFKEALKGFDCIIVNPTKEDMLKHVAFYVTRFGTDGMIEGVGYVGFNGRKPTEEPYSGIMIGEDYDEFDFDVR